MQRVGRARPRVRSQRRPMFGHRGTTGAVDPALCGGRVRRTPPPASDGLRASAERSSRHEACAEGNRSTRHRYRTRSVTRFHVIEDIARSRRAHPGFGSAERTEAGGVRSIDSGLRAFCGDHEMRRCGNGRARGGKADGGNEGKEEQHQGADWPPANGVHDGRQGYSSRSQSTSTVSMTSART